MQDTLITIEDVSQLLKVPVATLRRWRLVGYGPPAIKLGAGLRWDRSAVAGWVDSQRD